MGQGINNFVIVFTICSLIYGQMDLVRSEELIESLGCDSCGRDCSAVCGSRAFRSCCFNYIKKRSNNPSQASLANNDSGSGGTQASYSRDLLNEDQLLPIIPISSMRNGKGYNSETLEAANHRMLVLAEVPLRGVNTNHQQSASASRKFFLSSLK